MPRRSGRRRRPPPKEPKPPRQRQHDSSDDDDDEQDDVQFVNLLGPGFAAAAAAKGAGPVVPYGDPSLPPRLKYGPGKYEKYGWDRNAPPTAAQFQQLMQAFQYRCLVMMGDANLSDHSDEDEGAAADDDTSSEDEEPINAPAITSGEDEDSDGEGATIKYEFDKEAAEAALVEAVRGASRIKLLNLAQLHPSEGQDAELFPGPDKKVDMVLEALEAGTSRVEGLELYDAYWAESLDYSDRLVRLLGKYSGSLRFLSISSRALVQPNKKRRKHTVLKVVSRMPHLERLQMVYMPINRHFYTYNGEFRDNALFPALKDMELHLGLEWFKRQFQYAIPPVQDRWDRSMAGYRYSDECGGYKDEEKDTMLPDIMREKKDIISYLDMTPFGMPTTYRLPILDRFTQFANLRGIGVPVEHAAVTASMKTLEKVNLTFHQATADQAAAAAAFIQGERGSAVWAGLRHLNVNTQMPAKAQRIVKGWNGVLGALAATCKQLRQLKMTGRQGIGWDGDLLAALVEANQAHLEEMELTVSDSLLTPRHLELLLAAPALRSVKLRRAARGGGSALDEMVKSCSKAWSEKGVAVEWL